LNRSGTLFDDSEGAFMKGLVLVLVLLLGAPAIAAPAGHDICSGSIRRQKIEFVFATGALCCDATVKIGKIGKSTGTKTYNFSADIDDGIFSAKSDDGSIRYIVGYGDGIEVVLLSVNIGGVQIDNGVLICKKLDFRPDPMAN
jgi:hypothetical protein